MPRPKKEDSVITEEEKIEEPILATSFEYSSIGNVNYDFDKGDNVFELKAQTPFRMNQGDIRIVTAGLKIRIPEGFVGFVVNGDINPKSQVCVLGSPILITPEFEEKELLITLKMFGYGYKIYNMGDVMAKLIILPSKTIKIEKK